MDFLRAHCVLTERTTVFWQGQNQLLPLCAFEAKSNQTTFLAMLTVSVCTLAGPLLQRSGQW